MIDFLSRHVLVITIILLGVILVLLLTIVMHRYERKILSVKRERLSHQNKLMEMERLNYRLQPHALNNTLSHLKALSNKMPLSINSLSEVLEYIIYKGKNSFVNISDEVTYLKAFINLNKLSLLYDDAVIIEEDIDAASIYFGQNCIPHLITSYFIENAFKHGDKTAKDFLKVKIYLDKDSFKLEVINRHRQRNVTSKFHGIGLQNMKRRLELLLPSSYEITQNCDENIYKSVLLLNLNNGKNKGSHSRR